MIQSPVEPATAIRPPLYLTAPFRLVRVSGVSYDRLDELPGRAYREALANALGRSDALARAADQLNADLFAIIPRPELAPIQRELILLRRASHNGQLAKLSNKAKEILALHGRDDITERHACWAGAMEASRAANAAGSKVLAQDIDENVKPWLRTIATEGPVSRALCVAAPRLLLQAARWDWARPAGRLAKWQRSLLRYALRSATKTSPFSSFTLVGPLHAGSDGDEAARSAPAAPAFRTRVNRGLVTALLQSESARLNPDLTVTANATLRWRSAGCAEGLVTELKCFDGRPWRQDRVARFRLADPIGNVLITTRQATLREVHHRLVIAGLRGDQAEKMLSAWLESGLLHSPVCVDAYADDAARIAAYSLAPVHVPLVEELRAVASLYACSPQNPGALASRSDQAAIQLAPALPPKVEVRNVIVDDGSWSPSQDADADATLSVDVARGVAAFLAPKIVVNPLYARLRDYYVALYGAGAVICDVMSFLVASDGLIHDWAQSAVRRPEAPVAAPAGTRHPITVFAQPLQGAPAFGEPRYVVNRVYDGAGWLSARFAWGDSSRYQRLRADLRIWLRNVCEDREPIDLPYNGECSDLQAHPLLTDRILRWPTEPIRHDRASIELRHLMLAHDRSTNRLEFRLENGDVVAPMYLGSAIPLPGWGPIYSLIALTRPFVVTRPEDEPQGDVVTYRPREVSGNVVLRRAFWSIHADDVRSILRENSPFSRAVRLNECFARLGVPAVSFVSAEMQGRAVGLNNRSLDLQKPQWFDVKNPVCIDLLERIAQEAEWLRFSEMLPASDQLGTNTLTAGRHVVEHHVEMLVMAQ